MKNEKRYLFRLHEWAADLFSVVQYPKIRRVQSVPPKIRIARAVDVVVTAWIRLFIKVVVLLFAVSLCGLIYVMCRVFAEMFF